jgi:hypothetical protein
VALVLRPSISHSDSSRHSESIAFKTLLPELAMQRIILATDGRRLSRHLKGVFAAPRGLKCSDSGGGRSYRLHC